MWMPKERGPVPETSPTARSAFLGAASLTRVVEGWEVPTGDASGDVTLADLSGLAKVLVKAPAAGPTATRMATAMGTRFGRAAWDGDRLVTGAAPGEWLVLGPRGTAGGTVDHYRTVLATVTEDLVTVMELTHGRALLRVHGPATMSLLRRLTALDLDDRFVPDGSALRTSVAAVVTDVVRDDVAGSPSYLLHCERSSGRYLLDTLLAAGEDLGAQLQDGHPSWGGLETSR
jgi:heterotetrameric sarcosine oxidase gamma subunit